MESGYPAFTEGREEKSLNRRQQGKFHTEVTKVTEGKAYKHLGNGY